MKNIIVLDLETQRSFDDVGGRSAEHLPKLGISVAAIYSYPDERFFVFEESELEELSRRLQEADLMVGFNIRGFDVPVLAPYLNFPLSRIPTLDIFSDAQEELGFMVGLGHLAEATLGEKKSGSGLEALELFKRGKLQELKRYCMQDVKLTRDLYEFGLRERHLLFSGFSGLQAFPVHWGVNPEERAEIRGTIQRALSEQRTVAMDYVSRTSDSGKPFRKSREVDIYRINRVGAEEGEGGALEGYCHFRKGNRTFLVRRVVSVRPTERTYSIPLEYRK